MESCCTDFESISPQIYKTCPKLKVYDKNGKEIKTTSVNLDTDGSVVSIVTEDGRLVYCDELLIFSNFLEVPGVGFLKSGTKVCLEGSDVVYTLLFGWHTNISNQTIFSWFLRKELEVKNQDSDEYMSSYPEDPFQDLTVYKETIDKIWKITV